MCIRDRTGCDVTVTADVIAVVVIADVILYVTEAAAHRPLVQLRCRRDGQAPRHEHGRNAQAERRRHGNEDDVTRRHGDAPCGVNERLNGPDQLLLETML